MEERTMSKTRLVVGVSVGAVVLLVSALAGGATAKTAPTTKAASEKVITLGVITKFPVGFYFTLQNGAKKWDKAHAGAKVIFAQGRSATDDAGEIAAIQDMVAGGVKGIAIAPTSPAVVPALKKAQKQGVKIVLIDNDIPSWKGKSSVVATNNFKGGTLAGKYLAKHLKAGEKLGVLAGVPGVPSLDDRVNGMLAGLGTMRSKIKVVGKLETDCAQDKGFTAAQTILTANPDIKAMFSACGPPALGALQAIKRANIDPKGIWTVGFDAQPEEVAEIKAGNEDASVAQFPSRIGLLGVDTLWKVVNHKKVKKNVDTGTALVTQANAAKFSGP
jgi:simple sugar transport system substrate-binding protein